MYICINAGMHRLGRAAKESLNYLVIYIGAVPVY